MKLRDLGLAVAVLAAPAVASALPILPVSYDMLNGQSGSFTYHDDTYDGAGNPNVNLSPLSGGLGQLTDGVIPPVNWINDIFAYVGWTSIDPIITFHFEEGVTINSLTVYMDDNNGGGGVGPIAGLTVNGGAFVPVFNPPSPDPFGFTLNDLNLTGDVSLQLFRGFEWMMISEITFDGENAPAAVPEPGTLGLLGAALAGLTVYRRRK